MPIYKIKLLKSTRKVQELLQNGQSDEGHEEGDEGQGRGSSGASPKETQGDEGHEKVKLLSVNRFEP
jgi:hypothetical protein